MSTRRALEKEQAYKYIATAIHLGFGVHYQVIPAEYNTVVRNVKVSLFIEGLLYATTTSFVKLSLLAFYRRVFQVPSIRWPIWIMVACVVSWLVARV